MAVPIGHSSVTQPKQQDVNQVGLQGISEAIEKFSQKMVDTERQLRTEMENKLEKEIKTRNVCGYFNFRKCLRKRTKENNCDMTRRSRT
jgi:hypothetical protein